MKFSINTITLWSTRSEMRQLHFKKNKVNVLTGGSHRGKSAILDIFDYCFLGSTHKIPNSVINENTSWYGLTFSINDKQYTIARKSPVGNLVSDDVYFSSLGVIPEVPSANIKIDELKLILQAEFHIDEAVKIAYGGGALRAGSKVSFRYFFLFNTISEDIITSRDTYFDKQSEERYREALPRIFDLAMGIDSLENIAIREKRERLERQLEKEQRKAKRLEKGGSDFDAELKELAAKAISYGLPINQQQELTVDALKQTLTKASAPRDADELHEYSNVSASIFSIDRRLRMLRLLESEVSRYKKSNSATYDSLLPITELLNQTEYIVKSTVFDQLVSGLKADLSEVKKATEKKLPVEVQLRSIKNSLLEEREKFVEKQRSLPAKPESFETEKAKWIFIGETLGRLNAYFPKSDSAVNTTVEEDVDLQAQIDSLQVVDVQSKRDAVLSLVNEIASKLLKSTKTALDNYANWHPEFVYKEKRLRLRKPLSTLIENVGSSSNHMFMHLLHFLSLHETAITEKSPFIPSFLIIDQPSRPYYPPEKPKDEVQLESEEHEYVRLAFELLNEFVGTINADHKEDFQMIVFEHVTADAFKGLENIYVLPEFRGAERLIPESWYSN